MNIASAILKAIAAALPGIVAFLQAFKKKDKPTNKDIADKAAGEVAELEAWKKTIRR